MKRHSKVWFKGKEWKHRYRLKSIWSLNILWMHVLPGQIILTYEFMIIIDDFITSYNGLECLKSIVFFHLRISNWLNYNNNW